MKLSKRKTENFTTLVGQWKSAWCLDCDLPTETQEDEAYHRMEGHDTISLWDYDRTVQ